MPHEALDTVARPGTARPQVVLGDRFGASADPEIVDLVEQALLEAGFAVSRNAPFAGAYITQRYGRPASGYHAIQIEVDRGLYMNERTVRPATGFEETRSKIAHVLSRVIATLPGRVVPLAAE